MVSVLMYFLNDRDTSTNVLRCERSFAVAGKPKVDSGHGDGCPNEKIDEDRSGSIGGNAADRQSYDYEVLACNRDGRVCLRGLENSNKKISLAQVKREKTDP